MKNTWIVFTVNNKKVHQINYDGCVGKDVVDATKTMVANQNKVPETQVKIVFEESKPNNKIVELGLLGDIIKDVNQSFVKN